MPIFSNSAMRWARVLPSYFQYPQSCLQVAIESENAGQFGLCQSLGNEFLLSACPWVRFSKQWIAQPSGFPWSQWFHACFHLRNPSGMDCRPSHSSYVRSFCPSNRVVFMFLLIAASPFRSFLELAGLVDRLHHNQGDEE